MVAQELFLSRRLTLRQTRVEFACRLSPAGATLPRRREVTRHDRKLAKPKGLCLVTARPAARRGDSSGERLQGWRLACEPLKHEIGPSSQRATQGLTGSKATSRHP